MTAGGRNRSTDPERGAGYGEQGARSDVGVNSSFTPSCAVHWSTIVTFCRLCHTVRNASHDHHGSYPLVETLVRRMFTKLTGLAAVTLLGFTLAQPAQAGQHTPGTGRTAAVAPAYFEMTDGYSERNLVVKLVKEEQIQHARQLVGGETSERPHVIGRIVKHPAEYNRLYSFHYDPESVSFFDYAIEVCDATLSYTEDHLDEVGGPFLPGRIHCPWNSRLVREVTAP